MNESFKVLWGNNWEVDEWICLSCWETPKWLTAVSCVIRLITLFSIIQSFFLRMVCLKSFVCDCVAYCVKIFQLVRINTWPNRQCVSLDLSKLQTQAVTFIGNGYFQHLKRAHFTIMTYAESLWASRLSGLVMRWRFDGRVGWQGGSVFERMEWITRLPRWPPVLSATPSEKDPNRPPLSRESECVTDRLANWERCPVRNFSRRESEPLPKARWLLRVQYSP